MRRLCGIVLFAAVALGAPQEQESAIKVNVEVVNVLCTVYDKRGALVADLKKDDFEIRENGKPQEIRYFARETDLPLTVALMVDVSGSVGRFIEAEKGAAARFLETVLRPTDQALLLGFSSTLILWQDFTASTELLRNALLKLHSVPFRGLTAVDQAMPSTLLYDAVAATAADKFAKVSGRKAMVIISDGLDNGSRNHLEDAVRATQQTGTIVYGICYESGFSGCEYLKNLAEPSGGRMFRVNTKTTLEKIFGTIEDELRSQYALGYVSTNRARDGSFRKLDVRVRGKGFKVHARKGYYAAKENDEGGSEDPPR